MELEDMPPPRSSLKTGSEEEDKEDKSSKKEKRAERGRKECQRQVQNPSLKPQTKVTLFANQRAFSLHLTGISPLLHPDTSFFVFYTRASIQFPPPHPVREKKKKTIPWTEINL